MLPECKPLDYEYFHGTQYGFIGSVYGDNDIGISFDPPFRINIQKKIKNGSRTNLIEQVQQDFGSSNPHLDQITQNNYLKDELAFQRKTRLYDPMFKQLYLEYNDTCIYANDICSSIVYDVKLANNIVFARLNSTIIYFPLCNQEKIEFSNQKHLLLDMIPDFNNTLLYLAVGNNHLKVFDFNSNQKLSYYTFNCNKTIETCHKWCTIEYGSFYNEKYFMNESFLFLIDSREKYAKELLNSNKLRYFGFKQCSDTLYTSLDSEGVNIYDCRMFSTPICRRNHEYKNKAPRLYDAVQCGSSLCVLVGNHAFPSCTVIEFQFQDNQRVYPNYNTITSDVYPNYGDYFAYFDNYDASYLKLNSSVYSNTKKSVILTFNDNSVYLASLSRDINERIKDNISEMNGNMQCIPNDSHTNAHYAKQDYNQLMPIADPYKDNPLKPDTTDIEILPSNTCVVDNTSLESTIKTNHSNDLIYKFSTR